MLEKFTTGKPSILILPILTGLFVGTSLIPYWPWASLWAMIPLWFLWLKKKKFSIIIFSALIAEVTAYIVIATWLPSAIATFAEASILPSTFAALTMITGASTTYILSGILWFFSERIFNRSNNSLFSVASLAPLHCLAYTITIQYYPNNLGYSWITLKLPIIQFADIVGMEGLGFIFYAFNSLLLYLLIRKIPISISLKYIALALGFIFSLNILGKFHKPDSNYGEQRLKVLIVQPNISNENKILSYESIANRTLATQRIIDTIHLTRLKYQEKLDLIILPETAVPDRLDRHILNNTSALIKNMVLKDEIDLLIGAYAKPNNKIDQNSIFLLNPSNLYDPPYYTKEVLVPMAEYLPMPKLLWWAEHFRENVPTYEVPQNQELIEYK